MAKENNQISIRPDRIPEHVAIIMDGNGRWAKSKGHIRLFGHRHGVKTVREIVEAATEIGVKYLTLYAFSTENWNRPQSEVNGLMELLIDTIRDETDTLREKGIRLKTIGNRSQLPARCNKQLDETVEATKDGNRMTLVLALSYSGRWDIVEGGKFHAGRVMSETDASLQLELDSGKRVKARTAPRLMPICSPSFSAAAASPIRLAARRASSGSPT